MFEILLQLTTSENNGNLNLSLEASYVKIRNANMNPVA